MSLPEICWAKPPSRWVLNGAGIHVWAAALGHWTELLANFELMLSAEERARADRFHSRTDRDYFVTGRGILRRLLSVYLGEPPQQVQFSYGPNGKPAVLTPASEDRLFFNVAHSNGLFLAAFTRIGEVGIDVERIRLMENLDDLMEQLVSTTERFSWRALSEADRLTSFFQLWTRKEACLKATGAGITEQLAQVGVSFLPGENARVLKNSGVLESPEGWILKELEPAPGYAATLALRARSFDLSCWHWSN